MARIDGYLPLREYAAIGDGRTAALVGRDGSVDWLCVPDLDSASAFGALLDRDLGGRFELAPAVPFESEHRYVPDTNVLETTFRTAEGTARVTDALTLPDGRLGPYRELARRIEGVSGRVPLRWRVEPRFDYGRRAAAFRLHGGIAVGAARGDAVAVSSFDAGVPQVTGGAVAGELTATAGGSALLVLAIAHGEPLVLPPRDDVEARLDATAAFWRSWASERTYDGPWRDAVLRSALALKLLVFAPSGAIAAAPTTSLPETIGGSRNWDYRFSWPRDSAFTVRALLALGCSKEAEAYFSWTLHATQLTHPRLQVLYGLDGGNRAPERELPLEGYRGSRPVRVGNAAVDQKQLDVYGELLAAAAAFAERHGGLDREHARRIAGLADFVAGAWHEPDAGIWEVRSPPRHFTQSKMMCAVALDHAVALAEAGVLPDGRTERWRAEAARIRAFVDERCWSAARRTYVRAADDDAVDAALLLAVAHGYAPASDERLRSTVDAVRSRLGTDGLVRRYVDEDGLDGEEGAFVACSFWLVEALARQGLVDDATALMEELVARANDVGLYAEEIDPASGAFLGNFPQALSHLALVNAAVALTEAGA